MSTYYMSLPKKRMAAAALIQDESGNILIVKPTYRPDWLLPGGVIEANESPRQACSRELQEELCVCGAIGRLLCIDYLEPDGEKTESLQFVFDGGIFPATQIAHIQLPANELAEYRFVSLTEALVLLNPKLALRIPHSLGALAHHTTAYLEEGELIEGDISPQVAQSDSHKPLEGMQGWQPETIHTFRAFFETNRAVKALILVGSNTNASADFWSDVDFVCVIDDTQMDQFFPDTRWLMAFGDIFGLEQSTSSFKQVTRVCFADFRRVDLVFMPESAFVQPESWRYSAAESQVLFSRSAVVDATLGSKTFLQRELPEFSRQQFERMDQQFWFKAAMAVTKVRRNDLLIGFHLALDLARDCLVLAMFFRDVEIGTTIHRHGGPYNEIVDQIGLGDVHPTPQGILDLIVQIAFAYDALARRWYPTYHGKAEQLQKWSQSTAKHVERPFHAEKR